MKPSDRELLARCRAELIEPPTPDRVTEITRSALHQAEQALLTRIAGRVEPIAVEHLEAVIGRGGHPIATARTQQLALAQLVLSDPPIAVLDEATAEAGSAGARELETAAMRALEGRTALIVAHRLTQAVRADRIVVLHAGRVRETGTHDELVAAGGAYAGLWGASKSSRADAVVIDAGEVSA